MVLAQFGRYPVGKLVDGSYARLGLRPTWSPYHAWAIAHLLFFSEEWREPLQNYLAAVARGASLEEQRAALGDLSLLQAQVRDYRRSKLYYEQMTYPAERIPEPLVRQLTRSEAAYVKGKLELGARLELPPEPDAGIDPKKAAKMAAERRDAIKDREAWLRTLRATAARHTEDLELQLLLAEAECRSGHNSPASRLPIGCWRSRRNAPPRLPGKAPAWRSKRSPVPPPTAAKLCARRAR